LHLGAFIINIVFCLQLNETGGLKFHAVDACFDNELCYQDYANTKRYINNEALKQSPALHPCKVN